MSVPYECIKCGAQRFGQHAEGHLVCLVCQTVQPWYEESAVDAHESVAHFARQTLWSQSQSQQRKRQRAERAAQGPQAQRHRQRVQQRRQRRVQTAEALLLCETPAAVLALVYGQVGAVVCAQFGTDLGHRRYRRAAWRLLEGIWRARYPNDRRYVEQAFQSGSGPIKLRLQLHTLAAVVFIAQLYSCERPLDSAQFVQCWTAEREHVLADALTPYVHWVPGREGMARESLRVTAAAFVQQYGWPALQAFWARARSGTEDIPLVDAEAVAADLLQRIPEAGDSDVGSAATLLSWMQQQGWRRAETELELVADVVLAVALQRGQRTLALPCSSPTPDATPTAAENTTPLWPYYRLLTDVDAGRQHERLQVQCIERYRMQLPRTHRRQPWLDALIEALEQRHQHQNVWDISPWHTSAAVFETRRTQADTTQSCPRWLQAAVAYLDLPPARLAPCLFRRASDHGILASRPRQTS
ncbi:hypothetical protein CDCA_CDCA18G4607 [Cyanidium caldarium]|uniref:Uncharacterized protein n=1 Tax=Cyanidium caldarium TaxID=2771 RepID=A0AAV9J1Z8_CYACA|nr:hypothetical protein CDCA_CDCA18G4607 [Cyanidium caldarium]